MNTEELLNILAITFWGNTIKQWLLATLVFIVSYNILFAIKGFTSRQLHKYVGENHSLFRLISLLTDSVTWIFIACLSIYGASLQLQMNRKWDFFTDELPLIGFLIQLGAWGKVFLNYQFQGFIESKPDLKEKRQIRTIATPIKFIILGILWSILLLTCLSNLGVNVTAFVAGLGIGGVAIALAVQSTLSDLIASLSIAFGKPFMVGDFIILDTAMGTVESIGLKMTRVRSLGGELIVFPNSMLVTSRVINCNNMTDRRVVFTFSIQNRVDLETLKEIPQMVRESILAQDKTRFDRAHFARFGQYTYDYEVVYFIQNPDFNFYMDTQQAINLQLVQMFREHSIELAHPISEVSLSQNAYETVTSLIKKPAKTVNGKTNQR